MSLDCPWTLSHSHLTVTLTLPFMRLLLLSNSHCFDISLFLLANDLCLFKILPLTSLHTDTEARMTPAFFSRKHVFSENFGLHYVLPHWLHTTQTDDCFDPANRDHDMNKNQFCQWHWSWQWCDLVIALGALSVPVILIWLALLTYQILQYLNKPLFQKKKIVIPGRETILQQTSNYFQLLPWDTALEDQYSILTRAAISTNLQDLLLYESWGSSLEVVVLSMITAKTIAHIVRVNDGTSNWHRQRNLNQYSDKQRPMHLN